MILNADEIKEAVANKDIIIAPFDEANLKEASYTFTLGSKFKKLKKADFVDTQATEQIFDEGEISEAGYLLNPGDFIVLSSKESLRLSKNIACFLTVRGKVAQIGLDPVSSAMFCEPSSEGGFAGPLSLETVNQGPYPIKLFPGIKIIKAVFHRLNA